MHSCILYSPVAYPRFDLRGAWTLSDWGGGKKVIESVGGRSKCHFMRVLATFLLKLYLKLIASEEKNERKNSVLSIKKS